MILPRRQSLLELFAAQLTVDAKKLLTDEDTGEQRYTYIKTRPPVHPGENEEYRENHFRLALTYDQLAATRDSSGATLLSIHTEPSELGLWGDILRMRF